MAFYMKKSFGDNLLSDYINNDPNPSTLPLLEVYYYKLYNTAVLPLFVIAIEK